MGRPVKEPTVVVRLPALVVEQVDDWAQQRGLSRPEALRAILTAGLGVVGAPVKRAQDE
jgi:hypothetical protein